MVLVSGEDGSKERKRKKDKGNIDNINNKIRGGRNKESKVVKGKENRRRIRSVYKD